MSPLLKAQSCQKAFSDCSREAIYFTSLFLEMLEPVPHIWPLLRKCFTSLLGSSFCLFKSIVGTSKPGLWFIHIFIGHFVSGHCLGGSKHSVHVVYLSCLEHPFICLKHGSGKELLFIFNFFKKDRSTMPFSCSAFKTYLCLYAEVQP